MTDTTTPSLTAPEVLRLTEQMTLFRIDFRIWSGRKQLRAEDLHLGDQRPPVDLVSLGSKKVCNPEALRVFHRHKQQLERELLAVGTRFLGGYLIPDRRAAELQQRAAAIAAEAQAEAERFLTDYDRHIDAWCAAYPDWSSAIRNAVDPVEQVRRQFRFRVQALRIESSPVVAADTLADDLRDVGETIFTEVEQIARGLERSFVGQASLSRRALGTFRRVHEKLDALSFVDRRIDPVVHAIGQWLARLPLTGPIEGQRFLEGWALMRLVSDAETMARHGAGLLALEALMPAETACQTPALSDTGDRLPAEAADVASDFDVLFETPPQDTGEAASDRSSMTPPAEPTVAPPREPVHSQDFWF
ncbi:DUF3150 domain-containing protein [Lamprobacter modestohalophilus]|uniref:DUF3150 domain-containing protein n=1 Tax=Lamprobacter modestohalophilus TaxID=1064514 RepID=UPI002ADEEF0A|nr:DUF3150 domain-containing protein [Lamprobacter modestohalophilus]MEA1053379.1 DUF3150 domain-containing protein [Lamprobacter modestohalophilus]